MKSEFKILIVDDEKEMRLVLHELLNGEGYSVVEAENALQALKIYKKQNIDVVISDIIMPDMSGIELLKKLKDFDETAKVIMITGSTSVENAVEALKIGAEDYFTKPLMHIEIVKLLERLYKNARLQEREEILKKEILRQETTEMVGNSPRIRKIFSDIKLVADSDIPVFIMGDSGTGKELVARAIHDFSSRHNEPFVPINCAAIPSDLLESELFGHEKGAFSGALFRKFGLFETADNGTLLLDEIGELPLMMQAKLLRTVETMKLRRIGGTQEISINVRIICSTNRNIKMEIDEKRFRSDLYYRLSTFTILLPPLRDRREDIMIILDHFLRKKGKEDISISEEIIKAFECYDWPGNVRELEHVVERMVLMAENCHLTIKNLPAEIQNAYRCFDGAQSSDSKTVLEPLSNIEENHIFRILSHCNGNKKEAAQILGIGLKTLYRKLEKYN